jgi:hypothetical protein
MPSPGRGGQGQPVGAGRSGHQPPTGHTHCMHAQGAWLPPPALNNPSSRGLHVLHNSLCPGICMATPCPVIHTTIHSNTVRGLRASLSCAAHVLLCLHMQRPPPVPGSTTQSGAPWSGAETSDRSSGQAGGSHCHCHCGGLCAGEAVQARSKGRLQRRLSPTQVRGAGAAPPKRGGHPGPRHSTCHHETLAGTPSKAAHHPRLHSGTCCCCRWLRCTHTHVAQGRCAACRLLAATGTGVVKHPAGLLCQVAVGRTLVVAAPLSGAGRK